MKILLTGKNGQLGFELQRALAPLGNVIAVGHADCELLDSDALRALLRRVEPAIIVNAAAYTDVDKAETEEAAAFAVNAHVPAILGEEAARVGSLVVHYSTDYVFDGLKEGAYTETDQASPLSTYGRSKWDGECALAAAHRAHLLLRTSWILGAHGRNFAKTILRLAAERPQLAVVADQVGAPTPAQLLADVTAQLLRQYQREGASTFPYGTYHVAASGETSWYDYARFVIELASAAGKRLQAAPDDIAPLASDQYQTPAKRPMNSRLDTGHFRQTFGLTLPPWQAGVHHVLQQIFQK